MPTPSRTHPAPERLAAPAGRVRKRRPHREEPARGWLLISGLAAGAGLLVLALGAGLVVLVRFLPVSAPPEQAKALAPAAAAAPAALEQPIKAVPAIEPA